MGPKQPTLTNQRQHHRVVVGIVGAVSGSILLCLFSLLQKAIIGAPLFDPRGYLIPATIGALPGLIIALLYHQRLSQFQEIAYSHARYRELFDAMPLGRIIVDANGRILTANLAAQSILQASSEDALQGTNLSDIFAQIDEYQLFWNSLQVEQQVSPRELQLKTTNDRVHWAQIQGYAQRGKHVVQPSYIISLIDITVQKQVQKQLLQLQQAVFTSQDAIFMTDLDGLITFINPAFTRLYGYEADEVINLVTPRILKSGQMQPDDYAVFWQQLLNKQSLSTEIINKSKDGRLLHIEASANPILDEENQIIGFLAIQRDISNRVHDQQTLERHLRRLEIMRSIDHAILRETSPETIAAAALEAIEGLLPFLRISISLFDFPANKFTVLASKVHEEAALPTDREGKLDQFGIDLNQLRLTGTNTVEDIDQLEELTDVTDQLKKDGVRSFVNIALMIKGEMIGSLNLANNVPYPYSPEEISILQDVATQISLALHQAQLRQRNERQQQDLATLLTISQALATTIDLNRVMQLAIDQAVETMRVESGAIYLLEGDGELYLGATSPPLSPDMPEELRAAKLLHHPHINEAITSKHPVYLRDAATTTDLTPQEKAVRDSRNLRSLLYVPLPIGQRMIGVLILGTIAQPTWFSPQEINLAQTFSVQMALAVENARLHDQVKRHADELEDTVARRTEELLAANQQLEALSRLKDEFVSNVSHELRTPITSMKLYFDLLKKNPPKQEAYFKILERELIRLTTLIEDLLRLSRLEQDCVELDAQMVDLNFLVSQYVNDRRVIAQEQGLTLSLVEKSESVMVQADAGILGQAVSIMLTNAFNYTPLGGRVEVEVEDCKEWRCIHVSDTGSGISPDEMPFIFDRFYRGTASRASQAPGTGLGLSIAQEVVNRHQGQIDVCSPGRLGAGTTFTIQLPGA